MSQLPIFESGGIQAHSSQTHRFIWRITNVAEIVNSESLIEKQKFEVKLGLFGDLQTKWLVGFHLTQRRTFKIGVKLVEQCPTWTKVTAFLLFEFSSGDQEGPWTEIYRTSYPTTMTASDSLMLPVEWPIGGELITDGEGTLWCKFMLCLMQEEQPIVKATELAVCDFNTASLGDLQQDLKSLSESNDTYDLKIICSDGVELGGHKHILTARNSVLSAMLATDMTERKLSTIMVDDVSGETMKILLHYWYTGKLLPKWCDTQNIVEFTYAAGKYQLDIILQMLDKILGTSGNMLCDELLLELSNKLGLKNAETRLMQRVVKMACSAKTSKELVALFKDVNTT